MKYSVGNSKLGKNVLVVSRPVGTTCPPTCPYLGNICYARATERTFPNSRKAAENNIDITIEGVVDLLRKASKTDKSIRIHERGDFCCDCGKLDKNYINAWRRGINVALKLDGELPFMFAFTHKYTKTLANLPYINMYASVHNARDIKKAKAAGFKLFAYCTDMYKGKQGGNPDTPKFINIKGLGRCLVCPEQRLGRKRVNCGTNCGYCIYGRGNVCFIEH